MTPRQRTFPLVHRYGARIAEGTISAGWEVMDKEEPGSDEITIVLLECEATLRTLHGERRLTSTALHAFVDLSTRIKQAMERRRQADRRTVARSSPDRRVSSTVAGAIEPL